MRRKLISILAALVAVMLVAGVATAQETDQPADRTTDRPVDRLSDADYGRLWAFGSGTAVLDVERAGVKILLVGDISIEGPANLNVVIESWTDEPTPDFAPSDAGTSIVLEGFAGFVAVVGSDYTVEIDGVTALKGAGAGSAEFSGIGLWKTLHRQGQWPGVVGFTDPDAA